MLSEVDDAFFAIDAHSHKDVVIFPLQIEVIAVDSQDVSEPTFCFISHNVVIVSPPVSSEYVAHAKIDVVHPSNR